jgi:acyl-CoA thioester hydrolase
LSPARLDDLLEVETSLLGIGGATLELLQRVRRGGEEIARVMVRLACTNRAGRPRRLPAGLRSVLEGLEQPKERVE